MLLLVSGHKVYVSTWLMSWSSNVSENTFGTRFSRKLVLAEKVIRPGRGNSLKRFLRAVSGGGLETLGEGGEVSCCQPLLQH